ncbi:hypothetical protein H2201_009038, partial [Coniosporium apollinis]
MDNLETTQNITTVGTEVKAEPGVYVNEVIPDISLPDHVLNVLREQLRPFSCEIFVPGQEGYDEKIERFSDMAVKRAGAVILVTSAEEVSIVVKIARVKHIQFVVSAGRHSTGGASSVEGGIIIDLRKMRKVTVDPEAKTITAEGGCTWEDVDVEAAKYGLATVG